MTLEILDVASSFANRYFYWFVPTSVSTTDIIEILIITILLYEFLAWVKRTRAWALFKGIIIILFFVLIAAIFQMNTILWLAAKLINVGIIAVIVVFQPELRNALEHLGRRRIFAGLFSFASQEVVYRKEIERMAEEVVQAAGEMGRTLTGALICFEKEIPLDEYVRTGILVDSVVSRQLLRNIFEHNTPLHDGAVIVRENRIAAATCYLPLSDNMSINKSYGTRHRAAVGLSEISDSLVVVVSEETGKISVALDGKLDADLSVETLKETLVQYLCGDIVSISRWERLKRRFKHAEKNHE